MPKTVTGARREPPTWAPEVRAAMARAGLSQETVAARCGRRQYWLSRRLTGHTRAGRADLAAIARALRVPFASLAPAGHDTGEHEMGKKANGAAAGAGVAAVGTAGNNPAVTAAAMAAGAVIGAAGAAIADRKAKKKK